MKTKTHTISYSTCELNELNAEDKVLINNALEALNNSYSPYSHFKVGAAIMAEDGTIIKGCNQENMAYPSGLCAERSALFAMGSLGKKAKTIALAARNENDDPATAMPCGSCCQALIEHEKLISKHDIRVLILCKDESVIVFDNIKSLLPFSFELE